MESTNPVLRTLPWFNSKMNIVDKYRAQGAPSEIIDAFVKALGITTMFCLMMENPDVFHPVSQQSTTDDTPDSSR